MRTLVGSFFGMCGFALTVAILGDRLFPPHSHPDVSAKTFRMAEQDNAKLRSQVEMLEAKLDASHAKGIAVSVWQRVEADAARREMAKVIPVAAEGVDVGPGELIPATSLPSR